MKNKIEFEWNNVLQEIKVLNSLDFPSRCLNYSQCVTGNTNEESLNTGISLLSFRDTFFLPLFETIESSFFHFCSFERHIYGMRKLLCNNKSPNILKCSSYISFSILFHMYHFHSSRGFQMDKRCI